jgi:hypothetical protein
MPAPVTPLVGTLVRQSRVPAKRVQIAATAPLRRLQMERAKALHPNPVAAYLIHTSIRQLRPYWRRTAIKILLLMSL